jgi:hypothetical protein
MEKRLVHPFSIRREMSWFARNIGEVSPFRTLASFAGDDLGKLGLQGYPTLPRRKSFSSVLSILEFTDHFFLKAMSSAYRLARACIPCMNPWGASEIDILLAREKATGVFNGSCCERLAIMGTNRKDI